MVTQTIPRLKPREGQRIACIPMNFNYAITTQAIY